jgi:two-component system, NtrC family, sensor histidine kinase PilS
MNKGQLGQNQSDVIVARWMLILRPAVITATLGVGLVLLPTASLLPSGMERQPLAILVIGTYVLTGLYWLAMRFSGMTATMLATQIAFDIFIITVMIHYTGGVESPFVGFYFLSVMCASLFFGRFATYAFSTQAALFYTYYIFRVYLKTVGEDSLFNTPEGIDGVKLGTYVYAVLMYGVGFLSSTFAVRLRGKDTALDNILKLLREAKLDTLDILQSMTNGLVTVDNQNRIMYINRVAGSILDIDPVVAVGKNYNAYLHDRTRGLVDFLDRQGNKGPSLSEAEIEVRKRSGGVIPLGLTSMPLYDTEGGRRGTIVNFKDLTEKKKMQDMIRQSERMAAIGELSAAIAHEIRNPLASIANVVELLPDMDEKDEPQKQKLYRIIEKESARLQRISTEFLAFARIQNPDISSVDIHTVIDEVIALMENDPRKNEDVAIENEIPPGTIISFDPDHLRQVIFNVLINSMQAVEGAGTITFSRDIRLQEKEGYIRLICADTGPGFPEEALGRMFEPFFSTKHEGTGLGLAIVRKIIIANKGRVIARNLDGGGAEFILDAPTAGGA